MSEENVELTPKEVLDRIVNEDEFRIRTVGDAITVEFWEGESRASVELTRGGAAYLIGRLADALTHIIERANDDQAPVESPA